MRTAIKKSSNSNKIQKKENIYIENHARIDFSKADIDGFLKKCIGTKKDKKRIKEIFNLI